MDTSGNKHLSQWQLKYQRDHKSHSSLSGINNEEQSHSIGEWVACTKGSTTSLQLNLNEHVDSDIAEVIQQMKSVLSAGAETQSLMIAETDCAGVFKRNLLSDVNVSVGLDERLGDACLFHENDKDSFNTNQMAALFSKGKEEKIARTCLRCLAMHRKQEKKRLARAALIVQKKQRGNSLGGAYLSWKNYCRQMRVKETVLVLKFGRVVSKQFRQAFVSWKQITTAKNELAQEAAERYQHGMLSNVLSGWMKLTILSKGNNKVCVRCSRNEIILSNFINTHIIYSHFHLPQMLLQKAALKSTLRIFSVWVRTHKEMDRKVALADQTFSIRLLRRYLTLWLAAMRSKKTHDNPSINTATNESNSAPKQVTQKRHIKTDKENAQPNVLSPPIIQKKKNPSFNSPTPKLVLDMEIRRKERERRRQILKDRQAERQLQRKAEEEKRREVKEKQEMANQNAYLSHRLEEEKRKRLDAARRKQAFRLASLHYKMKLCHSMYKRWTKVFDLRAFNERKARSLNAFVSNKFTV